MDYSFKNALVEGEKNFTKDAHLGAPVKEDAKKIIKKEEKKNA